MLDNSNPTTLPTHLGLVLDGNRRWAKAQGIPTMRGHKKGAEVFKDISLAAFDRGIKFVSAYVFSTENWQRTKEEVGYLMRLLVKTVEMHLDTYSSAGVKILIVGRRQGLDKNIIKVLDKAEAKTANNTRGTLALCFNYGGREEIVDVVKQAISKKLKEDQIDTETLEQLLYCPEIPTIDLLVRTSGEQRTSGFMLYRSAYAELYFEDKMWPEYTADDLDKALLEYSQRKRRFGK